MKAREVFSKVTIYSSSNLSRRSALQVRCEALVGVDDHVGGDVVLTDGPPQRPQLRAHVAPLVVRVLLARRHLLHGVDVHVDVCGRVWRVQHLSEGQHKATGGVLQVDKR